MENRKVRGLVVEAIEKIEKNVQKFSADLSSGHIKDGGDSGGLATPNRLLRCIEEQIDAENRKIYKLETLKKIIIGVNELCDRLEYLDGFRYRYRQLSFGDFMGDFTDSGTEKKNVGRTVLAKEDIQGFLDNLKTVVNEEMLFLETDWNWEKVVKICREIEVTLCSLKNIICEKLN